MSRDDAGKAPSAGKKSLFEKARLRAKQAVSNSKTSAAKKPLKTKTRAKSEPTQRSATASTRQAFSAAKKSKTRNRTSSRHITAHQSEVARSVTGRPTSDREPVRYFSEDEATSKVSESLLRSLPSEDRRAVREQEEASDARERQALLARLPEEDRQAVRQATERQAAQEAGERIAGAESPQEKARLLGQELESGEVDERTLLEHVGPDVLADLEKAEPEVVAETLRRFSEISEGNEVVADILAEQLTESPPDDFTGVLDGLATASAGGHSELASVYAEKLREGEVPVADLVQQAADLKDVVGDIQRSVGPDDLAGSLSATERITQAVDGAPPQIARALLGELEENGSLAILTSNLREPALSQDGPLIAGAGAADYLTPVEGGRSLSSQQQFDRIVVGLSNAVSVAQDETITEAVASRLTYVIGEDIGRFDEAFELAVGQGRGAGLAGAVASQLHQEGRVDSSRNLVEGIEDGAQTLLNRFDTLADKVDQSNGDLAYLVTQWGAFYGDDEAGQQALGEEIQAFQEGRPEYAQLNEFSANVGGDLEVLRDLQNLFPEKQHLKDRERDLLREVPRFGATEKGRQQIADAVVRSGSGESTFLDRLMDDDFRDSLSQEDLQALGFDSFGDFRNASAQHMVSATVGALAEAAQLGDSDMVDKLNRGLVNQSELMDVDDSTLESISMAYQDIYDSSRALAESGGDVAALKLERAVESLEDATDGLDGSSLVLGQKLRVGGAAIGFLGGGLAWHQALSDGELTAGEAALATVPTLEGLLGAGEVAAGLNGGALFGKLTEEGFAKGAKVFAGVGLVLDGVGLYKALEAGDPAQAGISALSVAGSIATLAGATGVGAALGLGAAALGLAYGQYQKVQASNRFESEEAENFIRGALEINGLTPENIDDITHQLRNADDQGRQTGILIQQAAERGDLEPGELLSIIARQSPDNIHQIITAGHGVDPEGDGLDSLTPSDPVRDERIGERYGPRSPRLYGPETVEGFLIYLERQGYIERNQAGDIVGHSVLS